MLQRSPSPNMAAVAMAAAAEGSTVAAAPSAAHTPGALLTAATGAADTAVAEEWPAAHPRAGAMAELEVGVPAEALAPAPVD